MILLSPSGRPIAITLGVIALVFAACGGVSGDDEPDATNTPEPSPSPAASATPDIAEMFHGFTMPIRGGCLPTSDLLMPDAPRDYRGGTHQGVDFYDVDNCTEIVEDTPAVAAKDGVVVRADLDYHDITEEELDAANERIAAGDAEAFEVIDLLRGRQVWIDHGDGVITRYAHLGGIPSGIREGVNVAQGQTVGLIGDSGTPESIGSPGQETHLHWEVRIGESYLGAGLPSDEIRDIYEALFTEP